MPSGATAMALLAAQPHRDGTVVPTKKPVQPNPVPTGAPILCGSDGSVAMELLPGSVAVAAILSRCTVHKTVRGTQHYAYRSLWI